MGNTAGRDKTRGLTATYGGANIHLTVQDSENKDTWWIKLVIDNVAPARILPQVLCNVVTVTTKGRIVSQEVKGLIN